MKGFLQDGNAIFWERNHEKMCIAPWGSDSLRVRASMGTDLQMDLSGGLIDPTPTSALIEIREDRAIIRNGDITAELLEVGHLCFFHSAGVKLLEEDLKYAKRSGWPEARWYQAMPRTTWKDAWTDEVFQGGQTITADAPLKLLPLHLRGEKVLPIKA